MAASREVQEYLQEAGNPTVQSSDDTRAALRAFLVSAGRCRAQVARSIMLLREAEFAEADGNLAGDFEAGFQQLGALDREMAKIETAGRRAAHILRQVHLWEQRVRAAAEAASGNAAT